MRFGCYTHHAIDVGDGTVVHFGRGLHDLANACIEQVSWQEFCQGRPVEVVDSPRCFPAEEILNRAQSRLGQSDYQVFGNNCEGFVHWCRSDRSDSFQADRVRSAMKQVAAATAKPALTRRLTGAIVAAGPLPEVVQFAVETWVSRRTYSVNHGKRAGQVCGAATAFVVGFAKGGPASAVVTTSVWAGGQVAGERVAEQATRVFDAACRFVQRVRRK